MELEAAKTEKLSLMRGQRLRLTDEISVCHPTLGEIEKIGQEKYSNTLFTLIATSLDVADILWFDNNIWYEDIKNEWEFFVQKCMSDGMSSHVKMFKDNKLLRVEPNCVVVDKSYRDALNFYLGTSGEFVIVQYAIQGTDKPQSVLINVFYDEYNTLCLDTQKAFKFTEDFYNVTTSFLREIHYVKSDYDFLKGGTKSTKINILKWNHYEQRKKKIVQTITLDSIVSSLIAKGVGTTNVWDFPIYLIYDQYYRHHKINTYEHTALGYYTGNMGTDPKHPIKWENINWSNVI